MRSGEENRQAKENKSAEQNEDVCCPGGISRGNVERMKWRKEHANDPNTKLKPVGVCWHCADSKICDCSSCALPTGAGPCAACRPRPPVPVRHDEGNETDDDDYLTALADGEHFQPREPPRRKRRSTSAPAAFRARMHKVWSEALEGFNRETQRRELTLAENLTQLRLELLVQENAPKEDALCLRTPSRSGSSQSSRPSTT
jgi:hypothetical protein